MATFDDVRRIARAFPEAIEGTSYGTPAFHVRKKLFCRLWKDGATLVVKTEPGLNEALIASNPAVYFSTPHYAGYDYVLVRIGFIAQDELADLLADAWRVAAPAKLPAARK